MQHKTTSHFSSVGIHYYHRRFNQMHHLTWPYLSLIDHNWPYLDLVELAWSFSISHSCSGPPELRGMSLVGLKLDKSDIDTKMLPSAETPSSTETPSSAETPSSRKTTSPSNFKAGLLVVSLFGTLLIVGIVGCMGFWRERKKRMQTMVHKTSGRIVHYFRTPVERNDRREEMNILSQDYSECIMHEDY